MRYGRRRLLQTLLAGLIAVAGTVSSALADRGKIVVANRGSGTISIIDAQSAEWIADVPLPPGDRFPEPMYVVNTPYRNRVWVGDRANNRVVVFDGRTFDVVDTLPAGAGIWHQWADAFGNRMWVVNDLDKTATVIDANRLEVVAAVPMPADLTALGARPHDVVLDPLGLFAYVTMHAVDPAFDVIVQFHGESLAEVNRALVGKDPHVAFNWRTWELYAPCQGTGAVFVLDGLTLDQTDVIDVPGAHGAITSLNGRRFYTTNISGGGADAIFCIDTRTNEVLAEPADTAYTVPHNVALTPSGRLLYVTHSGANNKVSVFRARPDGSLEPIGDITVGSNPFGLSYVQ
jgi:DNA-binding beta-propeller fold protein YncE